MLIDQQPRAFESNTVNGTSAFTIAASSKAFQILSDQLYTDKPRAILRELSTNALDAHIDAGKADVPFEVQLPTTWDSTLVVKDFGTGMSPEQIKHLYTTYFGSDKTHTNDLVGGLGLGSKSPFSYTDQFTAVSRYDGIKYTYAAFIGEDNVPEISLVAQEDTDEPNGFEVHVPVKDSDIYTFERTAKRVFEFFDVKPILNQAIDFTDYDEPVMTLTYDGIECSLYTNQDSTIVMQGPIGYPVDYSAVTNDLDYNKKGKVQAFLQKGWRIKAPVGTFEITASREALSYNKQTINKLLETAHEILIQVEEETTTALFDATSIKDASDLIKASTKYLPGSMSLEGAQWNGLAWNGSGFPVDLPPDTQVREMKKRRYGRSQDPHVTEIYDETITLTDVTYHVYWSEKDRPFKQWVGANPVASDKERILYFTGPLGNLKRWIESVGLPVGREMPKASIVRAAGSGPKINYGATKYRGKCLTTGCGLHATANHIIEEEDAYLLLVDDQNGVYNYEQEFETFKSIQALNELDTDIYVFHVPEHHSKVTKAIQAHPGYIDRELLFDMCITPEDALRKIALVESLTESYHAIADYESLPDAVDPVFLTDEDLKAFITKIEAVADAQKGNHNADTIKNRLYNYPLDFTEASYTDLVAKLVKGQTQDLQSTWSVYKDILEPAVKGHSECTRWQYADSKIRQIVTEWVNTKTDLLSLTVTQEVA
jgi:hypothetical protein